MFKRIASTLITRFTAAAANLFIAILLSHYLGASGRGEQSLIITLISFIIIITGLIGSSTLSYQLQRKPFYALMIPSFLWVVGVVVLCYLLLPFSSLVPGGYRLDVCALSLLLSLLNMNNTVLISHQRINAANLLGLIQVLVTVGVLIAGYVLLKSSGLQVYILALYTGYGSALAVSFMLTRVYYRDAAMVPWAQWVSALRQLAVLGAYNQIAVFTQLLSFRLSYYLLNAWYGKEEVGIYANAVSVAESLWLIGRSIGTVQHSKIVNTTDTFASLALTGHLNRINLAVSVALMLALSAVPGSLYRILFGEEFQLINRIIWSLGPGIVFFGIALILGYYFSSTGKHFVNAIASAAGLVMTLVAGYVLIPRLGSYGAGITASLSYGLTALVVYLFFLREKKNLPTS
jgi:O-antigen/teichoic acid export membrane protein